MPKNIISVLCLISLLIGVVPVAHPFLVDDADTQGKAKTRIEIGGQMGFDQKSEVNDQGDPFAEKNREYEMRTILSYGITNTIDAILTVPYQWNQTKTNEQIVYDVNGISDIILEMKWRFFKREGLSFALKPGLTLPAGDKDKDLGTGSVSYSLLFIATKELDSWAFHLNLGYVRNENQLEQRKDIWQASAAAEWRVMKDLKLVTNAGIERIYHKSSSIDPAYILGGISYAVTDHLDIELGLKGALTSTEMDYTFMGGIIFSF